jgi:hypothetical protein
MNGCSTNLTRSFIFLQAVSLINRTQFKGNIYISISVPGKSLKVHVEHEDNPSRQYIL